MDIREYKDAFLSEAREYLSTLNNALVALEKNPSDKEQVHLIFRAAHTLKGMAATMGYVPMARLTHQMESAMDPVRQGVAPLTSSLSDALFSCLDLLADWLKVLETQDAIAEGSLQSVILMLESAARGERSLSDGAGANKSRLPAIASPAAGPADGIPPATAAPADPSVPPPAVEFPLTEDEVGVLRSARSGGFVVLQLSVELDPACAFKDVRAFMVLRNLNELGEIVQSDPSPEDIEKGRFPNVFHLLVLTDKPAEEIRSAILRVSEIAKVLVGPFDLERVRPLRAAPADPPSSPDAMKAPEPFPSAAAPSDEATPSAAPAAAKTDVHPEPSSVTPTVRVHTAKLDKMMSLVQELVIAKIRFEQVIHGRDFKELQDPFLNLHHITRELQDEIMQVRLVPIKHIFDRFPRMLRDLSKRLGKEVQFVMEGAEVELDRTIVDELAEPLVHLLRNAVDHGIESPEERKRDGKPASGTVRLTARRERAYVHISVTDDGKGIDADRVRRKAVQLGVVSEDEAREMTEEQIIRLITLPGMSTVQTATDVSGRGVGVDVAKTKIETLGGTLQIQTRKGHGTVFNLKFPLTLAIVKALLIRCDGEVFCVPVANVVETVDVPRAEIKWVQQQETLLLRDSVVPLYHLRSLLEMAPREAMEAPDPSSDFVSVLIFEVGDYRVGIIVDEVIGQQEVALKSLDRFLKGIRGYSGATILGNGRICLVLDIAGLLEELAGRRHRVESRPNPKEDADHVPQSR